MAEEPRPRKQEQERAGTDVVEMAPGILRLQLPISMPGLGHVNCYALVDDRGAAIVDPGLPGPITWRAIKNRLGQAGIPLRRVHTVIVTHSHPDHFGSAARLAKAAGAEVMTHSAFHTWFASPGRCSCSDPDHDHTVHDVDPDDISERRTWGDPMPWGGPGFKPPLKRRLMFRVMKSPLGRSLRLQPSIRVRHGDAVKLAGREWFAVHTPGHTIDHLCLHDPEHGVLLSGDHVLPTITPHISGVAGGRDPLALFFASLDRVAALDVTKVLPAHGQPFGDLPDRVTSIKEHHADRLDLLRRKGAEMGRAPVQEFSKHLFRPARWGPMADSETFAHLEHLRLAGHATREEQGGVLLYEVAGPA